MLALYRKNQITLDDLTRQLDKIKQERDTMQQRIEELKQPTPAEIIAQNRQTSAEFFQKFQQIFPKDYDLNEKDFGSKTS